MSEFNQKSKIGETFLEPIAEILINICRGNFIDFEIFKFGHYPRK